MEKSIESVFQDDDAYVYVLSSHLLSETSGGVNYGHVLVRLEHLAGDLFVTHECEIMKKYPDVPCNCIKSVINNFISRTNLTYEDLIIEQKKVILRPHFIQL